MKAISLTQPWATLVASGAKRIETRSWKTPHRGQIAIHASKGFPGWARLFAISDACIGTLRAAGYFTGDGWAVTDLPTGVVVATANLVDVIAVEAVRWESYAPGEYRFGDYTPGRFAWLLEDVRPLADPAPARGRLGLWEWAFLPPTGTNA